MQRAPWAAGVTKGTQEPLRSRPDRRRLQALSAREAAQAGTPLLGPSPHLSGRPPRTPIRAGGSRLGRGACARPPRTLAPPPLAAGRGRGRGRVRAVPEGGGLPRPVLASSGAQPPELSGAEPTEHFPASYKLTGPRCWGKSAWWPTVESQTGSKEARTRVKRLKRLGKFSTAVSAYGVYL